MKRPISMAGGCAMMVIGISALAGETAGQSIIFKHELTQCMTKKMSVDRSLSYYAAMRACRERLQPSKDALASNAVPEAASKPH